MLFYSILFPIISILGIILFLLRYLKEKDSLLTALLWVAFWVFVSVFAVLIYTIFKLYYKVDKLEDNINKIVKEVALSNEISLKDKEESYVIF